MINANEALDKVLTLDFHSVLDVGAGGVHANIFREHNKNVTTVNLKPPANFVGDYLKFTYLDFKKTFDCIWASHVLEHQPNVNLFLKKCYLDLDENGILAITVPPLKHNIVGGHVSLWNAGLLLYNLILAGFDCSEAMVKTYGYNISVIVRKKPLTLPELNMDFGDIETLSRFFPFPAQHGFDGNIVEVNW